MSDLPIHNPHDRFFKETFARPEVALAFLRQHLPPSLAASLDWSTLELLPDLLLDEHLSQRSCDLLFSVQWQGHPTLIHCLLEHQTTPDRFMPLRFLRYMVRIWDRWLRQHPEARKLPLVVPLVFHHSLKPWQHSTHFIDLLDTPDPDQSATAAWRQFSPAFEHLLVELGAAQVETVGEQAVLSVILKFLQAVLVGQDTHRIDQGMEVIRQLAEAQTDVAFVRTCFTYLFETSDTLDETDFIEQLKSMALSHELKRDAMTIAQKLRHEGRQEGVILARQKAVLDALEIRFGQVPDGLREAIGAIADETRLRALLQAAIQAASLEDFARQL